MAGNPNPLDIDGPNFDNEAFVAKLLKEKKLAELMDYEHIMVRQVKQLDSEMQTLVYENYNKFIAATDTIRKMKTDFVKMEDEMDKLAQNMDQITQLSEKVSYSLQGRRENIHKLVQTNNTLKNLQYIFELPNRLSEYVERKEYSLAVKAYVRAVPVLEQQKSHPSFHSIYTECQAIVNELKDHLKDGFRSRIASAKDLTATVNLLLQLNESPQSLSQEYLSFSTVHLQKDIDDLEEQVRRKSGDTHVSKDKVGRPSDAIASIPMDILEFVDAASSGFLGNFSLVVASYLDMFANRTMGEGSESGSTIRLLLQFAQERMQAYMSVMERRFMLDDTPDDSSLTVRALDRFHRRLQAISKLLPDTDFTDASIGIILRVAMHQADCCLAKLDLQFQHIIVDIRQQLAAPRPVTQAESAHFPLADLLTKLEQQTVQNLKSSLANLLQFTAYDVTFATKTGFLRPFGRYVRENMVASFFKRIITKSHQFSAGKADKAFVNSTVVLLLSRFCINLEASTCGYLLDLCEQQFRIAVDDDSGTGGNHRRSEAPVTSSSELCADMRRAAQLLLDRYVDTEGFALSQMLAKSVETRDWVGAVEPRSVRAVMKRVVEDLTTVDARVAQLYEEGTRKDRSSDSSRKTAGMHSLSSKQAAASKQQPQWATIAAGPSTDNAALLKKLWSEKIDYFAPVEFTKYSIVTGIVKICLKTLLECIRVRTFGKFGLQQVQVDCHYLQMYLWRFVSDENLVFHLLEEVMTSAALRCLEPSLMEPSVVEVICEQ